jgi:hypothetical protein
MLCVRPVQRVGPFYDIGKSIHSTIALTGMTSLPIPSAGIKPILSVFLDAVARERKAMQRLRVQNA